MNKLEEEDAVTDEVVRAYNDLKESERRVYHSGRPTVGDQVIFMVQNEKIPANKKLKIKYPLPGRDGLKITATLMVSPETRKDRDLDVKLTSGGVGSDNFKLNITSGDSGHGDVNDPYLLIVFGK